MLCSWLGVADSVSLKLGQPQNLCHIASAHKHCILCCRAMLPASRMASPACERSVSSEVPGNMWQTRRDCRWLVLACNGLSAQACA